MCHRRVLDLQLILIFQKKIKQLIESCWAPDPSTRPTALDVIDKMKEIRKNYKKNKSKWYLDPSIKITNDLKTNASPRK